jgi:hypothetical protein
MDTLFDTPFWESIAGSGADARGWPCSIDGMGFVMDLTASPQRSSESVVQDRKEATSTESLLLPPEVWRRGRDSWHQGNNQVSGDRDESLPYRFSSSKGVNVWEKWQLSLLHDTTQKVAVSSSNPWVGVVSGQLCVVDGTTLRWYADLTASAVTRTLAATAVSVTQSGSKVYVACSNGKVYSCTPGSTLVEFMTLSGVSFISYAKDFLIAAAANVLYNITSGAAQVIRTHPLAEFRWLDATEGLSCIYLIGGAGDKWVVHRLSIDESATTLNPPIVASMLPDGETGKALGSYMGYVFVGTDKGLRFGVPQSTGDVTLGPLVETTYSVRCFEGQGRFVWFGLSNFDVTTTGLGRVDLTTFTEPLAPAAASDIYAAASGEVTSVTTWLGKTVFAVAAIGVYIESTDLVASGYLIESDLTFSVPDVKNAHVAALRSKPLVGSAQLHFSYDEKAYVQVAAVPATGEVETGNVFLNGAQFGKVQAKIVLGRSVSDATQGPTITRWEVRAEAVTGKGSQFQIPVLLTSNAEVGGRTVGRDVDEDRERLIALVGTGKIVSYREGRLSWQVNMVDYVWKPTHLNSQGSYEGVLTLLAREVK